MENKEKITDKVLKKYEQYFINNNGISMSIVNTLFAFLLPLNDNEYNQVINDIKNNKIAAKLIPTNIYMKTKQLKYKIVVTSSPFLIAYMNMINLERLIELPNISEIVKTVFSQDYKQYIYSKAFSIYPYSHYDKNNRHLLLSLDNKEIEEEKSRIIKKFIDNLILDVTKEINEIDAVRYKFQLLFKAIDKTNDIVIAKKEYIIDGKKFQVSARAQTFKYFAVFQNNVPKDRNAIDIMKRLIKINPAGINKIKKHYIEHYSLPKINIEMANKLLKQVFRSKQFDYQRYITIKEMLKERYNMTDNMVENIVNYNDNFITIKPSAIYAKGSNFMDAVTELCRKNGKNSDKIIEEKSSELASIINKMMKDILITYLDMKVNYVQSIYEIVKNRDTKKFRSYSQQYIYKVTDIDYFTL